jgi:predicted nucleotide-binding protein/prolyl-tRNA editing enzyme YbaK/EbsC (Cys-tRNA(Pro) deacylase)
MITQRKDIPTGPPQEAQGLTIFVGSSSEAAAHYERVCGTLEEQGHHVKGWKSSFDKGESFLAALLRIADSVDAALLIATPDDVLHSRGELRPFLRDNVLFEAGLFIGAIGRLATGIVVAGNEAVKLPTDLAGVGVFSFRDGQDNIFARDVRLWATKVLLMQSSSAIARDIAARVRSIPHPSFGATKRLLIPRIGTLLTQASRGVIDLTPEQYFDRLRSEIESASAGTEVMAVASSLSTVRWANDPMQNHYIEQNFVARERGADIRRLFIFNKSTVTTAEAKNIHNHLLRNIPVRCISLESLAIPIDDLVLFKSPDEGVRAYKAHPDKSFSERVVEAQMMIDPDHCADLQRRFNEIWRIAWEPRSIKEAIEIPGMRIPPPPRHEFPPGLEMIPRWTSVEVITCRSAARARGHELHQELKSLVLATSQGLCVVHVPGDCTVSLRKVKDHLGTDEAHIADPEQLLELNLGPGTVCAVLDPVWSMRHLVDQRVFEIPEIVTNNGTRNGYFAFDPDELRSAQKVGIGDFVDRVETESPPRPKLQAAGSIDAASHEPL